jgi:hypothetical protein
VAGGARDVLAIGFVFHARSADSQHTRYARQARPCAALFL